MAETNKSTNDLIVAKLDQVLRELSELRHEQQRLSTSVAKLATTG